MPTTEQLHIYKNNVLNKIQSIVQGDVQVFWNNLHDTLYIRINNGTVHFTHLDRQAFIHAEIDPAGHTLASQTVEYYKMYLTKIFFHNKTVDLF